MIKTKQNKTKNLKRKKEVQQKKKNSFVHNVSVKSKLQHALPGKPPGI